MANEEIMKQSPAKAPGEATAAELEKAVSEKNGATFRNAMDEVTEYRASRTEESSKQFMQNLGKKLVDDDMLPSLAIYNARFEFNNLDTNHDGKLRRSELLSGAIKHPLERKLLALASELVPAQDDGTGDGSGFGAPDYYFTMDDLNTAQEREITNREERAHIRQLFKEGSDEKSLYDRVCNQTDGSIPLNMIDSYLNIAATNAKQINLSPADIKALQFVKTKIDNSGSFSDTIGLGTHKLSNDEVQALRKKLRVRHF